MVWCRMFVCDCYFREDGGVMSWSVFDVNEGVKQIQRECKRVREWWATSWREMMNALAAFEHVSYRIGRRFFRLPLGK